MDGNEDRMDDLAQNFAEEMNFTNDEDKKRFEKWIIRTFDNVDKEMEKGLIPITHITNFHRSPWLSLRFVDRDTAAQALEQRKSIPYFSAALFFIPDYMSPFPPEIESVSLSDEEPKKVEQNLAMLDRRSWVYSDLFQVRKDFSLSPKQRFKRCIDILMPVTRIGGVIDPRREWDFNLWHFAANFLLELNRSDLVIDLYLSLLKHIIKIQPEDKPINKCEIYSNLGYIYIERNIPKKAKRKFIEATIENLIHTGESEGGEEIVALRSFFGFTEIELIELQNLVKTATSLANPLEIYINFQNKETELKIRYLFDSWVNIDIGHARVLLDNVRGARTNDEKKKTLEEISEYLFSCVDGFEVLSSKRTASGEIDRTVRNNRTDHPLFISIGPYFIIEAKNWKVKAGAPEIIVLISKVRSADLNLGVAVTKEGITGSIDKDAKRVVHDAFISDKIITVVFDLDDLENILAGMNLLEMLQEKMMHVRFSEPVSRTY